jgi:hypothetical protein
MATDRRDRLAVELEYFSQQKAVWLTHKTGQYVVIKDSTPLGFYQTFEAAYRAGAETYGIETDFLVKQILKYEPVFFVL